MGKTELSGGDSIEKTWTQSHKQGGGGGRGWKKEVKERKRMGAEEERQRAFNCLEGAWQLRGEWREENLQQYWSVRLFHFSRHQPPPASPPSTQFAPVI